MTAPRTLAGRLLDGFLQDGAAPRLTWYGTDGERTELSGRVLGNWVTKAANLLAEEADAEPGTTVVLDLPVHWRALVWALGSWTTGARVVLPGAVERSADVVVTSRPGHDPRETDADLVLAVALPALAMRWTGPELTGGAVDAAAALMTYPDVLGYVSEPAEDDVALLGADLEATFGELTTWARGSRELGRPARDTDDDTTPVRALVSPADLDGLVEQALSVWRAGGSLVLAEPGTDEARLERIAQDERVDLRW
ncbi:TIGR03089 family protein [Georgenia subflava]|uniref:TIGR03089 family protein n=1 Tax=Georgenia subflava TaxID=1622177 RepID=A0A6N7EPJ0_9MICO|nr:TIGR03089 family protein [Georgenia subflava]MPV38066.1 TIGR03089 family protein [Georgenia subflava]